MPKEGLIVTKVFEADWSELEEWIKDKPDVIKKLYHSHPPDRLYMLTTIDLRVTLISYEESGTMTVEISNDFNNVFFERQIFGIKPETLVECDMPDLSKLRFRA